MIMKHMLAAGRYRKYLAVLCFAMQGLVLCAQDMPNVYKADMWVLVVRSDTVECGFRKTVWGSDAKNFCIGWADNQEHYCYEKQSVFHDKQSGTTTVLGTQVVTGDRYSLRLLLTDAGFCIWIANLDGGFPHIVISTANICVPANKDKLTWKK